MTSFNIMLNELQLALLRQSLSLGFIPLPKGFLKHRLLLSRLMPQRRRFRPFLFHLLCRCLRLFLPFLFRRQQLLPFLVGRFPLGQELRSFLLEAALIGITLLTAFLQDP